MTIFLLFIPICLITGYCIVRFVCGVRELLILFPLAIGAGTLVHFMLLNLLLRFTPPTSAGWIAFGIMLIGAVLIWFIRRKSASPAQLSVSRRTAFLLLIIWLLVAYIFLAEMQRIVAWDNVDHGPRAAMIARVGLPVGMYTRPDTCTGYHYAVNTVEGILWLQSGMVNPEIISDALSTYHLSLAIGLAFVFLWLIGGRKWVFWAGLGVFVFVFVSPAMWLSLIHQIEPVEEIIGTSATFEYSHIIEQEIFRLDFSPFPLPMGSWGFRPLAFGYRNAEEQAFWMVAFLALSGWHCLEQDRKWYWHTALGQVAVVSALYYSTAFPLVTIPIGLWYVYDFLRTWQLVYLRNLTAYVVPALILLVVQGGLITDIFFCSDSTNSRPEYAGAEPTAEASAFGISLKIPPAYGTENAAVYGFREVVKLDSPTNVWRTMLDWGIVPLLIAFVLLFYWRQKNIKAILLLGVSIVFILIPFLIEFEYSPENMARFANFPLWLVAAMSVHWIAAIRLPITYPPLHKFARNLIAVALVFGMTTDGLANFTVLLQRSQIEYDIMTPLDLEAQRDWYSVLDAHQESVFNPGVYLNRASRGQLVYLARSIMVFGTYSRNDTVGNLLLEARPRIYPWAGLGLPGDLRHLGYTHLYLGSSEYSRLNACQVQQLARPDQYQLLEEWRDNSGDFRRFYAIVGHETAQDWLPAVQDEIVRQLDPLQQLDYYETLCILAQWQAQYTADQPIFVPADADVFMQAISASSGIEMIPNTWMSLPLPGELSADGYEYVLIRPDLWSGATNPELLNLLNNPAYYELVATYILPRIEQPIYLYHAVSDARLDTLGLSSTLYTEYLAHNPSLALNETRVYSPQSRDQFLLDMLLVAGYLEAHELSTEERAHFFDLLKLHENAVLLDELGEEEEVALQEWQRTMQPAMLDQAGVDSVLLSVRWWGTAIDEQRINVLTDRTFYRALADWEFSRQDESYKYVYVLLEPLSTDE